MDADNTLLDFTRSEHDAIAETFAHFGLPSDDATIAIYSEVNDAHWKMLERGEIEKKMLMWKRFEAFCERTGLQADPKALAADYLLTLSTKSYMITGALEVCAALAQKCRMYIITNGDKRVQQGRFTPALWQSILKSAIFPRRLAMKSRISVILTPSWQISRISIPQRRWLWAIR